MLVKDEVVMTKQQRRSLFIALIFLSVAVVFAGWAYRIFIQKKLYINQEILEIIKKRAHETNTDALIIWNNEKIIHEQFSSDAPETYGVMSITKSITSMIFGILMLKKDITTFGTLVYEFFPEWKQGQKQLITLKHLMNHTSGLQDVSDVFQEIVPAPNAVQLALAAELQSSPGHAYFYNNKATNLLSGVIARITDKPLDEYANEHLFKPLHIETFCWQHDAAGNPYVMAGLHMKPYDLLKIGKLILNMGLWNGQQLIDKKWFDYAFTQSQPFIDNLGLLWWLLKDETNVHRPTIGFYAQGYLGQYLIIIPSKNIIAVRLVRYNEKYDKEYIRKISFEDFPQLVNQMIKRM